MILFVHHKQASSQHKKTSEACKRAKHRAFHKIKSKIYSSLLAIQIRIFLEVFNYERRLQGREVKNNFNT